MVKPILAVIALFPFIWPALPTFAGQPATEQWSTSSSRIASYDNTTTRYASDHILVKPVGQAVMSVPVAAGADIAAVVAEWARQDDIEFAEPDGLVYALGQETTWGWEEVKAGDAAATNSATGSGIVVAVVDTGVDYEHEDLDANNWVNTGETAGDGLDNDSNGYVDDYYGYDFIGSFFTSVAPDSDPQDEHSHGTHVAGIIAAENNSVGVRGVAPSATIMPVKVLDSGGTGFDSTVADGIRYAVDEGADIINLSLGSPLASNTLKSAIDYAATAGVLVIAASGNEYNFTTGSYPALYDTVVSVGASNEDGFKADFSNWGKVDVIAPGVDILSSIPGNQYTKYSGTSMATPHVAGVAALIVQTKSTGASGAAFLLASTADDFGILAGTDYMSGHGMVNALNATGTASAGAYLVADQGWVASDGSDDVTLTVRVRNSALAAVASDTVTWTTTAGTLSASSSTTDSSGKASVTLTVDDTTGLVTVTADPASADPTSLQVAVLSDVVSPTLIGVTPFVSSSEIDEETNEGEEEVIITGGNNSTSSSLSNNVYSAGDKLTIWAYATALDTEQHDVTMSYTVTDPDGEAVDQLTGTTETNIVGQAFWYWYFPQSRITTPPLKIPKTAAAGEYTLTVTITDDDSTETASQSSTFWVDELPKVLVVDNNSYCFDTPVEGLSFGFVAYCTGAPHFITQALNTLGYDVMVWDTTELGTPLAEDLALFPAVIWLDSTFAYADTYILQSYLDQGGNLLISSESMAAYNTYNDVPYDFLWNYLHARYVSTLAQPDQVSGVSGGIFDGLDFNISTYDLSGNGTRAMYSADELELNGADDVEAIFAYHQGDSATMTAGIRVATDTYRLVYLSFGLESINDGSGDDTKEHVLAVLVDWLVGDKATIAKVSDRRLPNNKDRTIMITGKHFNLSGTTSVKLNSIELSTVTVHSHTKITAVVPAGLEAGKYSLKIIGPDDRKTTFAKPIRVTTGDPIITTITPGYASNDLERDVIVTGYKFTPTSKVFLGADRITEVTFDSPNQLTITIPEDFTPGKYKLRVRNSNGRSDHKRRAVTVRVGFTERLAVDSVHEQVEALEKRLAQHGYFTDEPDTAFDSTTEIAVLRYQHSQTLEETGVLDVLTRYQLNTNE